MKSTVQFRCDPPPFGRVIGQRFCFPGNEPLLFDAFVARLLKLPRKYRTGVNAPSLHLSHHSTRKRKSR